MTKFKISSIVFISVLLIIVYFVLKYIVFPLLHLALGLAAGIIYTVFLAFAIVVAYIFLRKLLRKM